MTRRPLVILAAIAMATGGCSVAVKSGVHSFRSAEVESLRDRPTLSVWEMEVGVREFAGGRADLAFAFGAPEGPDRTDFQDFRLTSRYHVSRGKRVSPYVGGGIGWYKWFTRQSYTILPEDCFGIYLLYGCVLTEDLTLSSGFYPHATAGFEMRLTRSVEFLVEGRHDFGKTDGALDFGSDQVLIGIRGRFNR